LAIGVVLKGDASRVDRCYNGGLGDLAQVDYFSHRKRLSCPLATTNWNLFMASAQHSGCFFRFSTSSQLTRHVFLAALGVVLGSLPLASLTRSATAEDPPSTVAAPEDITDTDAKAAAEMEKRLVTESRQLTFEGRKAGEGYFSDDGKQLVFQSERHQGNPFYQIYVMDMETGDVERVSPGHGKTTCAWIHPNGDSILYASTQSDPKAVQKQKDEIEFRASGEERRYTWDYDENFDLFEFNRKSRKYINLTNTTGYDAEASWSPNGKLIAFTSNRNAFASPKMSKKDQEQFDRDPAYMNEIYIMDSDGGNVRQLTNVKGYDGGPFFSPDGKRICWRRFTPNGALAEVWTMNIDGSDQRQITRLGAMSWAPYYHPSGEYLIFTTNRHGFANFELYMVDAMGKAPPVRVTYTKGFDGLPVFSPDGKRLCWTSTRTVSKQSQIFIANWNHDVAREALGLGEFAEAETSSARKVAVQSRRESTSEFAPADIMRHVGYLCRDELEGRLTGAKGEHLATAYVAAYLDSLGIKPAGDEGEWFQEFQFPAGMTLGAHNFLVRGDESYKLDKEWRPLSFSANGAVRDSGVVFAGYGMVAPAAEGQEEYDSYVHLDVKDKWVVVFRYQPEGVDAKRRQHLSRPSELRFKTIVARDRGARGLIIVSGPNSKARQQLVPLRTDGALSGSSLPVVSVTDAVVAKWLKASGSKKSLKQLQDGLDSGDMAMGFELKGITLGAAIEVQQIEKTGRNVIGRLQLGKKPSEQVIVVGAHIDHLGRGKNSSSLAKADEKGMIHYGADDNASGVAAMLEVAEYLADQKKQGKLNGNRDILFAAWSGEELGLIGSNHFVKTYAASASSHSAHSHSAAAHSSDPKKKVGPVKVGPVKVTAKSGAAADAAHQAASSRHSVYPAIAACINMDMIGRLESKLVLQGIGSSSIWKGEIERRNAPVGLPITLQNDSYLPTDASSFYMYGVPILSAFTGSHGEYHSPRDTPDRLNYEGAAKVARLMGLVTRSLALRKEAPDYIRQAAPKEGQRKAKLRAYLGTVPDYAEDVKGVKLGGAAKGGPADKAGVKPGDVIVELAGRKIENIYDYTYAIEALKIGKPVKMIVLRNGRRIEMRLTPGSRD